MRFTCAIAGKGGHGGIPQQTIDPIVAASGIAVAMRAAAIHSSAFHISAFNGGTRFNIIPESALLVCTCAQEDFAQITAAAQAAAAAFRIELTIDKES